MLLSFQYIGGNEIHTPLCQPLCVFLVVAGPAVYQNALRVKLVDDFLCQGTVVDIQVKPVLCQVAVDCLVVFSGQVIQLLFREKLSENFEIFQREGDKHSACQVIQGKYFICQTPDGVRIKLVFQFQNTLLSIFFADVDIFLDFTVCELADCFVVGNS